MIVVESDRLVFFDVDDTLVKWSFSQEEAEQHGISFNNYGTETLLVPHQVHLDSLQKHKARGHKVVVWSAGGYEWAKAVVETLKIEHLVDIVMSKPSWVYDDLPASTFIPETNRIYKDDVLTEKIIKPINWDDPTQFETVSFEDLLGKDYEKPFKD